ncbi:uncharacterized protein JCM6883_005964 [Sporobolomyces salmoneus]|uniref:uncharacterized protein n=1 Tax=Sporobolomyces salmoneus TaxID=183962 RepID=UPI0031757941
MSLSDSDYSDEEVQQARVVWRTGPTQKVIPRPPPVQASTNSPYRVHSDATPKSKRTTKSAGLASPSAPSSSGEPAQRDAKKTKGRRKKRVTSSMPQRHEEPMDQTTLRLVRIPLLPKPNQSQATPPRVCRPSGKLGFSSSKSSVSHTLNLSNKTPQRPSSPARPCPVVPSPTTSRSPETTTILAANEPKAEVEEEDFDSYFDDFADESFELALSQIENREASKLAAASKKVSASQRSDKDETETKPMGRRVEPETEEAKVETASEKQRSTEELARKEIESLGDIDWGSDDDF